MMTTSDERRKAAELMRNEAADFRRIGEEYSGAWTVDLGDVPAIFQDITHYMGLDGAVRVDTIFDCIAGFIDPTCSMADCEWDNGERTWGCVCSACGAHIEHTRGCFLDYCPHCGARCADDD